MQYASFWRRFGAFWLDGIILTPVMVFQMWGTEQYRLFYLYFFFPGLIFFFWYNTYIVKKYGGTPGKLLLRIKIVKIEGADIGYKEAIIRYSIDFFFLVVTWIIIITVFYKITDSDYYTLEWQARSSFINSKIPSKYNIIFMLEILWIASEFVVMLTNTRRRAIHDFLAGTVVVHKAKQASGVQSPALSTHEK